MLSRIMKMLLGPCKEEIQLYHTIHVHKEYDQWVYTDPKSVASLGEAGVLLSRSLPLLTEGEKSNSLSIFLDSLFSHQALDCRVGTVLYFSNDKEHLESLLEQHPNKLQLRTFKVRNFPKGALRLFTQYFEGIEDKEDGFIYLVHQAELVEKYARIAKEKGYDIIISNTYEIIEIANGIYYTHQASNRDKILRFPHWKLRVAKLAPNSIWEENWLKEYKELAPNLNMNHIHVVEIKFPTEIINGYYIKAYEG